jgi:hypothetical protein
MSEATFQRKVYTIDNPKGLACVVASMGGKIVEFAQPALTLNGLGYDTAVYEYGRSVYLSGEPEQLPALITSMSSDFEDLGSAYDTKLYTGASGGSFIGFNLQRRAEGPQVGLYATAGIPISEIVTRSPIFRLLGARRAFAKHGYDEAGLQESWKTIEMSLDDPPPIDQSISVVLGGRDKFVNYDRALSNLTVWKDAGVPIEIIKKPELGHFETVKWFKAHIDILLKKAPRL